MLWPKQPEWRRLHKDEMNANIAQFRADIRSLKRPPEPLQLTQIQDEIELRTQYEDYIYKSRQAQHIHYQVYGPTAVGIASAFIALIAAVAAYATYLSPHSPALETQADTVIKIIQQSSDQGQAYFKLKAFQDTGLITIGEDKLQRLLKGWYTPPK
jgi:hypothetical protein